MYKYLPQILQIYAEIISVISVISGNEASFHEKHNTRCKYTKTSCFGYIIPPFFDPSANENFHQTIIL